MDYEEFFFLFQIDEMIERMNKVIEKKYIYYWVFVVSFFFNFENNYKIIVVYF